MDGRVLSAVRTEPVAGVINVFSAAPAGREARHSKFYEISGNLMGPTLSLSGADGPKGARAGSPGQRG